MVLPLSENRIQLQRYVKAKEVNMINSGATQAPQPNMRILSDDQVFEIRRAAFDLMFSVRFRVLHKEARTGEIHPTTVADIGIWAKELTRNNQGHRM